MYLLLKDHKVSVPDIDSGAKEGEEAFLFKSEKDENYDYEVQMFNRYLGKNGMVDQPIGTMWMYRFVGLFLCISTPLYISLSLKFLGSNGLQMAW